MSKHTCIAVTLAYLAVGCTPLQSSPEPSGPSSSAVARSEAAGEDTLRIWADALRTGNGAAGCAVSTRQFQQYVIDNEVAWKRVPRSTSCAEAVSSMSDSERSLNHSFVVEDIDLIRSYKDGLWADYEVQWRESEEGDGSGYRLVWRSGRYLIEHPDLSSKPTRKSR